MDRVLAVARTQAKVARDLGVSAATVSQWCNHKRPVPPLRAQQMQALYGVPAKDLCPRVGMLLRMRRRHLKANEIGGR